MPKIEAPKIPSVELPKPKKKVKKLDESWYPTEMSPLEERGLDKFGAKIRGEKTPAPAEEKKETSSFGFPSFGGSSKPKASVEPTGGVNKAKGTDRFSVGKKVATKTPSTAKKASSPLKRSAQKSQKKSLPPPKKEQKDEAAKSKSRGWTRPSI